MRNKYWTEFQVAWLSKIWRERDSDGQNHELFWEENYRNVPIDRGSCSASNRRKCIVFKGKNTKETIVYASFI